ncbi:MAG: MurR/RpiR family transcriptional regulator [Clostridiales bacterium]|nr:MurR/RpiR family transcriptional regulator [Clostridiales bacterium]
MINSLDFKIKSVYPILRQSEKRAADYILNNKKGVADMSMKDFAEKAGVSQPTVMRMVKALGFEGYMAFKRYLKYNRNDSEIPADNALRPWDTMESLAAKTVASSIHMLEETLQTINIKNLEQAVNIIVSSENIAVCGVENSYSIALDLTNKLTYLGIKCISYSDVYLQKVSASNLTSKDAAVCISLSGTSRDTVETAKTVKQSGAKIIAITNNEKSPLCDYSDIVLDTGNTDITIYGDAIFSRVTQSAVITMLYMGIILTNYEYYSKKLQKSGNLIKNKQYTEDL